MRSLTKPQSKQSGLRPAPGPAAELSAIEIAIYYIDFYESDFVRSRRVVKRRARNATVGSAIANGAIVVTGTLTAAADKPWIGTVSASLGVLIAILAVWDNFFRHRDLWIQRSMIVSQLHELQREVRLQRAIGANDNDLAGISLGKLNSILEADLRTWTDLREQETPTHDQPR